jgi:hypothetical protein
MRVVSDEWKGTIRRKLAVVDMARCDDAEKKLLQDSINIGLNFSKNQFYSSFES